MYKILADGKTLYLPGDEVCSSRDIVVKLAVGDSGYASFSIPESNPSYATLENRRTEITVLKNDKEIFYGEIRDIDKNIYGEKEVYAVGELAYLNDSIQEYGKYQNITPREFLGKLLDRHNKTTEERKHFRLGIVTITDPNDSIYRYTNHEKTLACIRDKLVDRLGGVLRVRKTGGVRYLDYIRLEEYGKYCEQVIKLGENMFDYAENVTSSDLITALVPLGARLEDEELTEEAEGLSALDIRVDITSVNDGKDYIYIPEAVNRYGWVWGTNKWDDVHVPANLLKKGREYLESVQYENMSLSLTAVDLSNLDSSIDAIEIGDRVKAVAEPFGMSRVFPVQELELHLDSPAEDRVKLGDKVNVTFTQSQTSSENKNKAESEENGYIMTEWLKSAIDNATQMLTGSKGGYRLDEYDENGLFLRTLYMDAPRKEDAVNILQIGPMGIGFSRTGYVGPYLSAWTIDGVLLGEYIKAHSIKAEALETEYIESVEKKIEDAETGAKEWANDKITTQIKAVQSQITLSVETERSRASGVEEKLSSRITVNQNSISSEVSRATGAESILSSKITQTENSISSEVTRAKNAESTLSSQIKQTADSITLCVKDEDLTGNKIISRINMSSTTATIAASRVNINADDIRLKASKISWSSTYSSMNENGKLTCSDINIKDGTLATTDGSFNAKLESGRLRFGVNGSYGASISSYDNVRSLNIQAPDTLCLTFGSLAIVKSNVAYLTYTGTKNGLEFVNGICVM